jgi:hypothetical protein
LQLTAARASACQHTTPPTSKHRSKSKISNGSVNSVKDKLSEEEKSWITEWSKEDEAREKGCSKKRLAAIKSSKGTVRKQPRFVVGSIMAKAAMEDLVQAAGSSGTCTAGVLHATCNILDSFLEVKP